MIAKTITESDLMGAIARGLCAVHCLATPFLFLAQSCSTSGCCQSGPTWWSFIDYIFIVITWLAVYQSGKHTSNSWIKYALYINWLLLSILAINSKLAFVTVATVWKYMAAFSLIGLHLYNRRYCQCSQQGCSVTEIV